MANLTAEQQKALHEILKAIQDFRSFLRNPYQISKTVDLFEAKMTNPSPEVFVTPAAPICSVVDVQPIKQMELQEDKEVLPPPQFTRPLRNMVEQLVSNKSLKASASQVRKSQGLEPNYKFRKRKYQATSATSESKAYRPSLSKVMKISFVSKKGSSQRNADLAMSLANFGMHFRNYRKLPKKILQEPGFEALSKAKKPHTLFIYKDSGVESQISSGVDLSFGEFKANSVSGNNKGEIPKASDVVNDRFNQALRVKKNSLRKRYYTTHKGKMKSDQRSQTLKLSFRVSSPTNRLFLGEDSKNSMAVNLVKDSQHAGTRKARFKQHFYQIQKRREKEKHQAAMYKIGSARPVVKKTCSTMFSFPSPNKMEMEDLYGEVEGNKGKLTTGSMEILVMSSLLTKTAYVDGVDFWSKLPARSRAVGEELIEGLKMQDQWWFMERSDGSETWIGKQLLQFFHAFQVWEPGGLPTKAAQWNWPEQFHNHGDMLKLILKLQVISLQRKTDEGIMNVSTQLDQLVVCPDVAIETWLEIFGCENREHMLPLDEQADRVWERGRLLVTHDYWKLSENCYRREHALKCRFLLEMSCVASVGFKAYEKDRIKALMRAELSHDEFKVVLADLKFHLKHKWISRLKMVVGNFFKDKFLQQIPYSIESIFKVGDSSPAARLHDMWDHFDRRSAEADENLRLIPSSNKSRLMCKKIMKWDAKDLSQFLISAGMFQVKHKWRYKLFLLVSALELRGKQKNRRALIPESNTSVYQDLKRIIEHGKRLQSKSPKSWRFKFKTSSENESMPEQELYQAEQEQSYDGGDVKQLMCDDMKSHMKHKWRSKQLEDATCGSRYESFISQVKNSFIEICVYEIFHLQRPPELGLATEHGRELHQDFCFSSLRTKMSWKGEYCDRIILWIRFTTVISGLANLFMHLGLSIWFSKLYINVVSSF